MGRGAATEHVEDDGLAGFRREVRAFLEANAPADWKGWFEAATFEDRRAFLDEHAAKLRPRRYLAPHWPVEFGGGGFSAAQQVVLKQEMQRVDFPPVGGGIAFHHAAGTIIAHGTPEQQAALPRILDGEIWCQGFSEPDAGSDLASLRTRAVRHGDVYVVDGQKTWSTGAMHAQWCLLLARTDPVAPKHQGISVFMVDLSLPGIEIRPIRQATGGAEFCEIFFTDVRVPADCRLGPENEGWAIAHTTMATERGSFIIENHAALDRALRALCREAACTPVGGGRMASEDGAIRGELARRAAEVDVLGMLTEMVVGRTLRHGEMGSEASIIKLFYSEALQALTELGMRVRGVPADLEPALTPLGYTSGHWMIDHIGSWTWTIAAGSNEIQRNIIAERVLGLPREPSPGYGRREPARTEGG